MFNKLISYALVVRDRMHTLNILKSNISAKERYTADIIRLVHSIEKGLCIENPRLGFGFAKLMKLFSLCTTYADLYGCNEFCLKMARDAIKEYITYHGTKDYQSEQFTQICDAYNNFPCKETEGTEIFGGVINVEHKCELSFEQLATFFADRHSIRDFKDEDISEEELLQAFKAAQYAPSACNRQAVRAYVLSEEQICKFYKNDLSGIGGFADKANKFILITGKISAYDKGEINQHIVSASIFATYLIEALFTLKIGTCMIQRPLYLSKQWESIAKELGIPTDERLVIMIAVGRIKDEYLAPVSKRFPTESIVKFI